MIEAGLGTCSFDVSFPSLPLAREDDPCPRKAQTNTPPSYSDGERPAKPHSTMGAFQKAGENRTLANASLLLHVALNCFN